MITEIGWYKIEEIYNENMIESKEMPIYFDYFNLSKDFKNVYEPAEDSFLMIDCLQLEKNKILDRASPGFQSAEIGCGSGLVSSVLLSIIGNKTNLTHYMVDINNDCLDLSERLLNHYKLSTNVKFIKSDLFEYFNSCVTKLDLIIFNPPYVTTDQEELDLAKERSDISASWAGGIAGSEVIHRFIRGLSSVIYEKTVVYLLLSEENEYSKIIEYMHDFLGFKYDCLLKRRAQNEALAIFKFYF